MPFLSTVLYITPTKHTFEKHCTPKSALAQDECHPITRQPPNPNESLLPSRWEAIQGGIPFMMLKFHMDLEVTWISTHSLMKLVEQSRYSSCIMHSCEFLVMSHENPESSKLCAYLHYQNEGNHLYTLTAHGTGLLPSTRTPKPSNNGSG